jgi:hypothetical protein
VRAEGAEGAEDGDGFHGGQAWVTHQDLA